MAAPHTPTLAAKQAIQRIGRDLRRARLRRRLPTKIVADRAAISLPTLRRVERGDPAVAFGIYASVMHALGLVGTLGTLIAEDPAGDALEDSRLPQRIRLPKPLVP